MEKCSPFFCTKELLLWPVKVLSVQLFIRTGVIYPLLKNDGCKFNPCTYANDASEIIAWSKILLQINLVWITFHASIKTRRAKRYWRKEEKLHPFANKCVCYLSHRFVFSDHVENSGSVGFGSMGSWEPINLWTVGSGIHQFWRESTKFYRLFCSRQAWN